VARWLSPLPKLERLRAGAGDPAGRVLRSSVSGTFDATRFPDPETLDIHREEGPTLAFGFGRHSCPGLQVTLHEAGALLEALLPDRPGWRLDGEAGVVWADEDVGGRTVRIVERFDALPALASPGPPGG